MKTLSEQTAQYNQLLDKIPVPATHTCLQGTTQGKITAALKMKATCSSSNSGKKRRKKRSGKSWPHITQ